MSEKEIQSKVLLAVGSRKDTRLFRNTVGHCETLDGRHIKYGLCPGSADLIGWHTVVVTPDMVGKKVALFLSIEVKAQKGKGPSPEQLNWLRAVSEAGGMSIVVRSPEQAVTFLGLQKGKQIGS